MHILVTNDDGIHAPGIGIAIPHADAEWTLVPGMIVGALDEPVIFEPMGGQGGGGAGTAGFSAADL